jgi:capsular polysaccharide biosynthesis protein
MNDWSLSDQVRLTVQRWPYLLASALVGAILGGLAGLIWPPVYEARQEIYVGLNSVPVPEEHRRLEQSYFNFRNVDDYKNWQMEQLNQFLFTSEVIEPTLNRLEESAIKSELEEQLSTTSGIQNTLRAEWRTAGRWQLAVRSPEPYSAQRIVEAWATSGVEASQAAVENAREMLDLELERQDLVHRQNSHRERLNKLRQVRQALTTRAAELEEVTETLTIIQRQALWGLASQAAGFTPAWMDILAEIPQADAPSTEYINWIDRILVQIEEDLRLTSGQVQETALLFSATSEAYQKALEESYGLAPGLVVEGLATGGASVQAIRPTGLLIASGALLGVIGWFFWLMVRISLSRPV